MRVGFYFSFLFIFPGLLRASALRPFASYSANIKENMFSQSSLLRRYPAVFFLSLMVA